MGNGKGLGNLFLCIEKLFWFSIWKYILVLKHPMFHLVDFQLHCTIFSKQKIPSNLNYPFLGHFPLHFLALSKDFNHIISYFPKKRWWIFHGENTSCFQISKYFGPCSFLHHVTLVCKCGKHVSMASCFIQLHLWI